MALTKQELVRNKLQTKVFDVIGKTVTLKRKDSPTYNTRGEEEDTTYTESSITIVPYNIMFNRQSYDPFGTSDAGDMDFAVPYTVSVIIDDVLVIEGEDWRVIEISPNYLPDNAVSIIRVSKVQP